MNEQSRAGFDKKYLAGVAIWEIWLAVAKAESDEKCITECEQYIVELKDKNSNLLKALDAFDETGFGVTFANESSTAWAVIIVDSTENAVDVAKESFRYQLYDRSGFIGHETYPSPYAAIAEAFDMGFTVPCISQLDELATTDQWKKGMVAIHAAQQSWLSAAGAN